MDKKQQVNTIYLTKYRKKKNYPEQAQARRETFHLAELLWGFEMKITEQSIRRKTKTKNKSYNEPEKYHTLCSV